METINRFIFIACLILSCMIDMHAQKSLRVIDSPKCTKQNTTAVINSIYTVGDSIVIVKIDLNSTEDKTNFIPYCSLNAKLVTNGDSLPLRNIIALKKGTSTPTDDDLLGLHYWKNIEKGQTYSCLVLFNGRIKKGVKSITMTDGQIDTNYSFENIQLDNPIKRIPSKYYIAKTLSQIQIYENASTDSKILGVVKTSDILVLDAAKSFGNFYEVIVLKTGQKGYVIKHSVKLLNRISEQQNGTFQVISTTDTNEPPKAKIFNNTNLSLSLNISGITYTLKPKQKRVISMKSGLLYYIASATGVNPYFGSQMFKNGDEYTWEFRIVTKWLK